MQVTHGWLLRDDSLSWTVGGVALDPATKTRREEYTWVLDRLRSVRSLWPSTPILDAAAGYVPTWHELPKMLSNKGFDVVALDLDPRSIQMPPVPHVLRMLGDITQLPFADKSFDVVVCISVLEHLSGLDIIDAGSELMRVCRKKLLITADWGNWLPKSLGQELGSPIPDEPSLYPPVYWMEVDL